MAQGLSLEQKILQRLSPLQMQMIQMLHLPQKELEDYVRKALEENPVLEELPPRQDGGGEDAENSEPHAKDVSIDAYKDDSIPFYKLFVNNYGRDERPQRDTLSVKEGITESLMEQLGFRDLTDRERQIAAFIIGSIDADGYLRRSIMSVADDMALRAGMQVEDEEVERMLNVVQEFEPAGVGARDLRECLLLQLKGKEESSQVRVAHLILDKYFTLFSNHHYDKIMAKAGLTQEQLKAAIQYIGRLNPHPGGMVDDSYADKAQQIIPDFHLSFKEDGSFDLSLPRFKVPEPRLAKEYSKMLNTPAQSKSEKEANAFVKSHFDAANLLVEAVKQRQNTLLKTMGAILDYQHDFFVDGEEKHLRPMVLKDIAEVTGFDISTISRVANSKYIETPFGVFSLKSFFSEGMENKDGEEISTKEIKKVLRDCVDKEDKSAPLTDDQLVEALSEKGYKIARRTIAKYRDQLSIPSARLRREI
ncbi:MAG: RNA polymerase factor sigma-54 [Bacteroidales bacterium]|nr:RNA polymerase factor sigma-54 [Bacteroidales bacterium]